jgi:ABC-type multidrug transport system ATPase subunit
VAITWRGLSAFSKDKVILKDCEGYCKPGEMLAIMGPSGAGKTTLLSIISKRNNPMLTIKGDVTFF